MVTIRKAITTDYHKLIQLSEQYNVKFDIAHLISLLVVADENDNPVGFGSLVSLLEGSYLVDQTLNKTDRVNGLLGVMNGAKQLALDNGYDLFHAFTEYPNVERLLKQKLGFTPGIGTNLIVSLK